MTLEDRIDKLIADLLELKAALGTKSSDTHTARVHPGWKLRLQAEANREGKTVDAFLLQTLARTKNMNDDQRKLVAAVPTPPERAKREYTDGALQIKFVVKTAPQRRLWASLRATCEDDEQAVRVLAYYGITRHTRRKKGK